MKTCLRMIVYGIYSFGSLKHRRIPPLKFLQLSLAVLILSFSAFAQNYSWTHGTWTVQGDNFGFTVNSSNLRMKVTCDFPQLCLLYQGDQFGRQMTLVKRYQDGDGNTVEKYKFAQPLKPHHPEESFICEMPSIGWRFTYKFEVEGAAPPVVNAWAK